MTKMGIVWATESEKVLISMFVQTYSQDPATFFFDMWTQKKTLFDVHSSTKSKTTLWMSLPEYWGY